MRKAWRFRDLENVETYYLPVNPLEDGGSHGITKNVKYEAAVSTYMSPYGDSMVDAVVIQDAPSEQGSFSYSGTLYTKEEYDAFMHWASKPYPWELRDDLGREFLIFVQEFNVQRMRSAKYVWKHSYTFAGFILEELGV